MWEIWMGAEARSTGRCPAIGVGGLARLRFSIWWGGFGGRVGIRAGFTPIADLTDLIQTFRIEAAGALVPTIGDCGNTFRYAGDGASERAYAAGEGLPGTIVVVPFCVADAVKIGLVRPASEK